MAQTRIVSFSELDTFRQCPHKHEKAYKERWVGLERSPALAKGSLWHLVMEEHYKAMLDGNTARSLETAHVRVLKLLCDQATQVADPAIIDLIAWMYDGYVEKWGWDPEWKILGVEHSAEVWLPTAAGGRSGFKLKMKMDLLIQDLKRRIWLNDHKSCSRLPSNKDLDLDDQFGLYTWGMAKLGHPVFGQIHNAARTQRNKGAMLLEERFSRTQMVRTSAELECIAVEAWRTAKRAYQIKPGCAERATDPDRCGWRCNFTEACLWGRKAGPKEENRFLIDTGFTQCFDRH